MPGPWDDLMKMLVGANPQHFVTWLLEGAEYKGERSTELKNRTIEADILYNLTLNGKEMVLHIEFQRRRAYNLYLWCSCLLIRYLLEEGWARYRVSISNSYSQWRDSPSFLLQERQAVGSSGRNIETNRLNRIASTIAIDERWSASRGSR